MRKNYYATGVLAALLALGAPSLAWGGNIPQYFVSKGGTPYAEFSDGTAIPCAWSGGNLVIFPGEVETPNAHKAEGFPIGFDFRFGGHVFNQFIVSNNGNVYLGNGSVDYGGEAFRLGMAPVMHGLYRADISYKTSGTPGSRVLTVQYKRAILNEQSTSKGKYSLQIRMYEADGKVEIAFKELETLYSSGNGFDTGLSGWDGEDVMQLTATGIDKPVSISPKLKANMLENDSYILWDSGDYDNGYSPVFVFSPVTDTTPPSSAPENLEVSQSGTTLSISCSRADGADATVVLVSESPFTDSDLPVDGETFRAAYRDTGGKQIFPTTLGNARALYYGNAADILLTLDGVEDGKAYYVKAISANGYPAYNRTNTADVVYRSTQPAPRSLTAASDGENRVAVNVSADDNVIVAMTTEVLSGYQKGYIGTFGTPDADAAVGDELPDGGKVVYVGEPSGFNADVAANTLTFFRAWTVKDGVVSSNSADAFGIADPSFPYAPAIENWPYGEDLKVWQATEHQFVPWQRAYAGDRAIYAATSEDREITLSTPELPLDRPVRVSFEFAMETQIPPAEGSEGAGILLPQGNKPGDFGATGYLKVIAGGQMQRMVNTYSGTMTGSETGGYNDGSSTFEPVSVDIPAVGEGQRITFAFSVPAASMLYLRDIVIEATGEAPSAPKTIPTSLAADEDKSGIITFGCDRAEDAANTLVLYSEKPFADSDMPEDGRLYAVGQKIGKATVIYYGSDEHIICSPDVSMLPDFDTDCYFRALSASATPRYNRAETADLTYRTLPDMGYPENLTATLSADGGTINVTADKASGAEGTLLLISPERFDGELEDGKTYTDGETVGNATVIYAGTDAAVNVGVAVAGLPTNTGNNVFITGYSYNSRLWYGNIERSVSLATTGIEGVEADATDLSTAEIYNVAGIRLSVDSLENLPAGIYIVNGKKITVR